MTSSITGLNSQPVPRKIVEKTFERQFDGNGNCTWEKITETERIVHDIPSFPGWAASSVMPNAGGTMSSSGT